MEGRATAGASINFKLGPIFLISQLCDGSDLIPGFGCSGGRVPYYRIYDGVFNLCRLCQLYECS